MNLFTELKRRNVFRVAAAYAVVAWLIVQVGDVAADNLGFPDWFMPMLFVLLGLGFPVAVFLAWAFELTPDGMKREKEVAPDESIAPKTGRKLDRLIMGVLILAVAVLLAERFWPGGEGAHDAEIDRSIAVLPFDDFSPDGSDAWFANGLAEEILNALAQTPDLRVASRTSSFRYRQSDHSVSEIGDALGVAHVLEGSVRRSPERIRVTAQLIRSDDGFHVWSETYDREPSEVITIQEDIAADIATALETAMDPAALREMVQVGTSSVEAYTAFLRGSDLIRQAEATGQFVIQPAIEAMRQATELDPGFAEASYRLAQLYRDASSSSSMMQDRTLSPDEAWSRASEAIHDAIDASDDSPERLKYQSYQADMQGGFRLAQRRLEEYLALRPNDLRAWEDYARMGRQQQDQGRVQQASDAMLRIAPDDPNTLYRVGTQLTLTGSPQEGANYMVRALRQDPGNEQIRYQTHRALLWAGRYSEAAQLEPEILSGDLSETFRPAVRARAACLAGERSVVESIARDNPRRWDRWYARVLLGDPQGAAEALMALDATPAGRGDLAVYLIYPFFDPSPFPNLSRQLAREGIVRAPPIDIPFACPPATAVSIAVLPFVNMSANADQEYFSDGMTEEIINALVRQTGLSVAARTSVFAFKNDNRNVSEIGRSLGVSHVIEGSVRSSNNTVRITAQLIDVANGFHEWSETYDRELTDVFAVQEEIAANVAAALTASFSEPAPASNVLTTADPEAYKKFLQARSLLRQRGEVSVAQAAELLAEVTRRDPDFAPGWATAAIVANVSNRLDAAFEYAERALALDPDNVDALTALASSHRASWQWREAERVFDRALALDPESSELLEDYAEFLGMVGRFDEMLEVGEKGFLIDPYLPPLAAVYAEALMIAGRLEDAARVMTEALIPSSPGWLFTYSIAASLQMDRPDQALLILRGLDGPSAALELVTAVLENPADEAAVAALESYLDSNLEAEIFEVLVGQFALLHAGRPERVLEFQTRLVEQNLQGELEWIFAPLFDEVRRLPGFVDYLEAVNLPAYWDATGWPDRCTRVQSGEIKCS